MNPVTKAVTDIKMTIPKEILDLAFNNEYNNMESIESKIESVIRMRVLADTNLVSGVTIHIPLSSVSILDTDEYGGKIIEIPEKLLNSRKILSVHSIVSNGATNNTTSATQMESSCSDGSGQLAQEALKIATNLSNHYIEVTSNLEVIGERTIHIKDPLTNLRDNVLRLVVENQTLLNNLPPRAYITFSILVSRAIKAHIYNQLIIKLDQGYIRTGHQMGIVQSIIESYADMNEMYLEYLTTTWTSVTFMSDNTEMSSYISSLFSNNT